MLKPHLKPSSGRPRLPRVLIHSTRTMYCFAAERALFGAHDADRTRDLVLTKDVLYQLSYVGPEHVRLSPVAKTTLSRRTSHVSRLHLERAMGFEPTTASLEGWNSTTELRPPRSNYPSIQGFYPPPGIGGMSTFRHKQKLCDNHCWRLSRRTSAVWWAGKGSNLGSHKAADLQSAPFVHLGTCPSGHMEPNRFSVSRCADKSWP